MVSMYLEGRKGDSSQVKIPIVVTVFQRGSHHPDQDLECKHNLYNLQYHILHTIVHCIQSIAFYTLHATSYTNHCTFYLTGFILEIKCSIQTWKKGEFKTRKDGFDTWKSRLKIKKGYRTGINPIYSALFNLSTLGREFWLVFPILKFTLKYLANWDK